MEARISSAAFIFALVLIPVSLPAQTCGDGIVESGEACDDGGAVNGDGCSAYCETERLQTGRQRSCINRLGKAAAKLASLQAKEVAGCIKDAGSGLGADPAGCMVADLGGKIARAKEKVTRTAMRSCPELPDFVSAAAAAIKREAVAQELALATDVFGDDLGASLSGFLAGCSASTPPRSLRDCARCPASAARDFGAVLGAKFDGFRRCKKRGLKTGHVDSRARLEQCFEDIKADPRGKSARAAARLARHVTRKCGLDISAAFPGACRDSVSAGALAQCVATLADCRVCLMVNAADGLGVDCDAFDDGAVNASCVAEGDPGVSLCSQPQAGQVVLPADEGVHYEDLEWWYWTGHLRAADGRWFGFEQVFFLAPTVAGMFQMAHHSITDVAGKTFNYAVGVGPWDGVEPANGFAFAVDGLTAAGYDGVDLIHGELPGGTLDLELHATKRPVLQHGDGYFDYPMGGFTYYYSRERMAAAGTLVLAGESIEVTGTGWFDHQWGGLSGVTGAGWDWFALQLDDDREVMAAQVHDDAGPVLVGGSLTDANCNTQELHAGQVVIAPQGQWISPRTGCTYPMGWDLDIDGMRLSVVPVLDNQELVSPVSTYWEGAAEVRGDATGRAYVELVGYCP